MAEKASKAVPAMAVAGVLVAAPHATAAAKVPVSSAVIVEQAHAGSVVGLHEPPRRYTVRPGDTMSSIAQRFYGHAADWRLLYQANRSVVHDPDMIFPGEVLKIPGKPARSTTSTRATPTALTTSATPSGTLSCHGLEQLWEKAGGSSAHAFMAAEIAMAESSGRQFATGPVGERGYWQINTNHGSLSTYDPLGNARAAVIISANGTNWHPWTTFTSGAYRGRCVPSRLT
ncbi:MAG TPA: LysM peptidoglycan-binding domain-containing protein [Streptosporangiaceae bacterium]